MKLKIPIQIHDAVQEPAGGWGSIENKCQGLTNKMQAAESRTGYFGAPLMQARKFP